MTYSHPNTRGGQTTHHTGRRQVSAKRSRACLTELYADRERYAEMLTEAQRVENTERIEEITRWQRGNHSAIEQHEAND